MDELSYFYINFDEKILTKVVSSLHFYLMCNASKNMPAPDFLKIDKKIDKWINIHQIRQYFLLSKFYAIQ